MGCGKSKQAVAIDNAAVLSRKKSSSRSQSLRDVERNHNVTAGTNENIPTNNDNGNKSNGNGSINTSHNGNVASGAKQEAKKNANGSSAVHASGDDVKSDIEAKTEEVQEETREGKESNKNEEAIVRDNDDKKEEVIVIIHEKSEYEGKSDEKFESDTPSNGAPEEDSVAENVQVDDAVVEEEKNGGENKEVANDDAGTEKEIKEEQIPETDTLSTPEEKAEDKPQPEI